MDLTHDVQRLEAGLPVTSAPRWERDDAPAQSAWRGQCEPLQALLARLEEQEAHFLRRTDWAAAA